MKSYTRKLIRLSPYTYVLTVPKEVITKYSWKEKQKLSIVDEGGGRLSVRDWKRR